MSQVASVILTSFLWDKDKLDMLNALPWYEGGRGLISCTDKRFQPPWYGGDKHLEMNVWLGAFHDMDLDALVAAIQQITWEDPECVRLFVCTGDVGRFIRIDCQLPPKAEDDPEDEDREDAD
jgi:hypothetical protein